MDFVDEVSFQVTGGRGGDGCVSFRREKFVPKGGPDGGDGGNGGHVILRVNPQLTTLFHLRTKKLYKAQRGHHGKGKNMHGRRGETVEIPVPSGTLVYDTDRGICLGDLTSAGQTLIVAEGGNGGKGNARFASPTRQAPDFAMEGKTGISRWIRLELKLLADVGLVGKPNAGKSTLLASLTAAKPKIADYPFTTLVPNLGIVPLGEYRQCVMADIPGLIEGAHEGKGLGDRFLRHIERTRLLVFMIESHAGDIGAEYALLKQELKQFDATLLEKPRVIALTKTDLLGEAEKKGLPEQIDRCRCYGISAVTGEGIGAFKGEIGLQIGKMNHAASS
ncbi:GTPase ObgE [bacterium]|nr:GTPase ObgE [bacterium]